MIEKTIIILANSVKKHKHCVAGKDIDTKKWVRPVGDKNGKELEDSEVKYINKNREWSVKPLDKILMKLDKKVPLENQPENYLISSEKWETKYKIEKHELKDYVDNPENLWLKNTSLDTKVDRISSEIINSKQIVISQSLYLIHVDSILLYRRNLDNKRRGKFTYNGIEYDLALTDPKFKDLKEENLQDKYLCISLGEDFEGYCYKIIASVI